MANESTTAVTKMIDAARHGDHEAVAALFSTAYEELRRIAHRLRRRESADTLNTTALVHEAYIKLVPGKGLPVESLAHFKHIAGRAMRQILVDGARARSASKRGGREAVVVTLDEGAHGRSLSDQQLLQLDSALSELHDVDPRTASVVECRFFGGLDVEETAAFLGVSTATVKRDWRVARAWLADALS